jgi:hypothetical protein
MLAPGAAAPESPIKAARGVEQFRLVDLGEVGRDVFRSFARSRGSTSSGIGD